MIALACALTFAGIATGQQMVVDFTYDPAAPTVGAAVTFTSTSSLSRPIVGEYWDLDSDAQVDASGHSVTYTYTAPGTYTVSLLVQNDRGRVRSTSKSVTVAPAAPPQPATPAPAPPPQPPPPPAPPPSTAPTPIPPPPPPGPVTASTTGAPAITPFPVVRIAGSYTRSGVRLRLMVVTAPPGVTITVRCSGRGCPYVRSGPFVVGASKSSSAGTARRIRIRGISGRLLRPGARLQIFVAQADRIGKYTSFRIRRGHPPMRADRCLRPGGTSVFACT